MDGYNNTLFPSRRTPEEFNRGHPIGAVNIPYMYKTSAGMTKNPDFVKDVKSIFGEDTELIVVFLLIVVQ